VIIVILNTIIHLNRMPSLLQDPSLSQEEKDSYFLQIVNELPYSRKEVVVQNLLDDDADITISPPPPSVYPKDLTLISLTLIGIQNRKAYDKIFRLCRSRIGENMQDTTEHNDPSTLIIHPDLFPETYTLRRLNYTTFSADRDIFKDKNLLPFILQGFVVDSTSYGIQVVMQRFKAMDPDRILAVLMAKKIPMSNPNVGTNHLHSLPPELLDHYILGRELAHVKTLNHSTDNLDTMISLLEDYIADPYMARISRLFWASSNALEFNIFHSFQFSVFAYDDDFDFIQRFMQYHPYTQATGEEENPDRDEILQRFHPFIMRDDPPLLQYDNLLLGTLVFKVCIPRSVRSPAVNFDILFKPLSPFGDTVAMYIEIHGVGWLDDHDVTVRSARAFKYFIQNCLFLYYGQMFEQKRSLKHIVRPLY
jgi:hypothetical protein